MATKKSHKQENHRWYMYRYACMCLCTHHNTSPSHTTHCVSPSPILFRAPSLSAAIYCVHIPRVHWYVDGSNRRWQVYWRRLVPSIRSTHTHRHAHNQTRTAFNSVFASRFNCVKQSMIVLLFTRKSNPNQMYELHDGYEVFQRQFEIYGFLFTAIEVRK